MSPCCPVCLEPVSGATRCADCDWELSRGHTLGPAHPQMVAAFEERLVAAQRDWDLHAAARAGVRHDPSTWTRAAGGRWPDPSAGRPEPGAPARDSTHVEGHPEVDAAVRRLESGVVPTLWFISCGPAGLAAEAVVADGRGGSRPRGDQLAWRWPDVSAELSPVPLVLAFQLACGVGTVGVDRDRLDHAVGTLLARRTGGDGELVVLADAPGSPLLHRVTALLRRDPRFVAEVEGDPRCRPEELPARVRRHLRRSSVGAGGDRGRPARGPAGRRPAGSPGPAHRPVAALAGPLDLICAVDLCATDEHQVTERLRLAGDLVRALVRRSGSDHLLRVGMVGYLDHVEPRAALDPARATLRDRPLGSAGTALAELERWAPRPQRRDFGSSLEDALRYAAGQPWRRDAGRALVVFGARPPSLPHPRGHLPGCPWHIDWASQLNRLDRKELRRFAVLDPLDSSPAVPAGDAARRHADAAWPQVAPDGLLRAAGTTADDLEAEVARQAGQLRPAAVPIPGAIGPGRRREDSHDH